MPIKIFILLPFFAALFHFSLSLSENPPRPQVRVDQNPPHIVFPILNHVYPDGFFKFVIQIGKPPKPVLVDFDTGSDVSWLQCGKVCQGCTKPPKDRYMPHANYIPCSHRLCKALSLPKKSVCSNDQCEFEVKFGYEISVSGALVHDKFPLAAGDDLNNQIVFGCVNNMRGFKKLIGGGELDGSIGLGRGELSYNSQLSKAISMKNVIIHCISRTGKSYLSLGLNHVQQPSTITWTKLLNIPGSESRHITAMSQIFYGRSKMVVKGIKNVIFDIGSTYSYFNKNILEVLFSEIKNGLKWKPMVEVPESEKEKELKSLVCWKASKGPFKSIVDAKSYFAI